MERCSLCREKFMSVMLNAFCDDCGVLMNKEFHTRNADIERRDERKDIGALIVSVRKRMIRKWGNFYQNGSTAPQLLRNGVIPSLKNRKLRTVKVLKRRGSAKERFIAALKNGKKRTL